MDNGVISERNPRTRCRGLGESRGGCLGGIGGAETGSGRLGGRVDSGMEWKADEAISMSIQT